MFSDKDIDNFIYLKNLAGTISSDNKKFLILSKYQSDYLIQGILRVLIDFLESTYPEDFLLRTRAHQKLSSEFDLNYIRHYKKKRKVFTDTFQFESHNGIFTKRFFGKCEIENCNINFLMLPSLEFHHLVLKKKDKTYLPFSRNILNHKYDKVGKLIESQYGGFAILCRNHHRLESASIYTSYYKYIYVDHLYYNARGKFLSVRKFEQNLGFYRKELTFSPNIKKGIIDYIKKKYIIEYVFGKRYKCCICNSVSIEKKLPAFSFHHIKPQLKIRSITELIRDNFDVNFIINSIIQEECVCLCANDHRMSHSFIFRLHYDKIIGKSFKNKVESYYKLNDSRLNLQNQKILGLKSKLNSIYSK